MLDDRSQAHSWQAHEAPPELGVKQARRTHTDLGKTGQVLGRSMQDPLDL